MLLINVNLHLQRIFIFSINIISVFYLFFSFHAQVAANPLPEEPGCWIRYPSGCPKQKTRPQYNYLQNKLTWNYETYGDAKDNHKKCFKREQKINNWCGVNDIIVEYNYDVDEEH